MLDSTATLEKTYDRRFAADIEYREAVWKVLVRQFFSRYISSSDHVLDLGCGYGHFINNVQCAGKYAMDLNPAARNLVHHEVRLFEQDCSDPWPLEAAQLDLVFTSNFLEHLPTKGHLAKTLHEAYRCLRSGGKFIAMGPNIKYVPGAYWDFIDHHIALTELSLQEALEVIGFRSMQIVGRFLPYTMVGTRKYPLAFLSAYLNLPFAWRWFGAQFLVVVTKP